MPGPLLAYYPHRRYIVGLDLSLTGTGWAVLSHPATVTYGTITPSAKARGMQRLDEIITAIHRVATDTPAAETWILIEGYGFASQRGFALGELGGLVRYSLWKMGFSYLEVPPARLKKFVTGRGNVDKNLMIKEVFKRFHYDVDDDNQADALGLMHLGLALTDVQLAKCKLLKGQHALVQEMLVELHRNSDTRGIALVRSTP